MSGSGLVSERTVSLPRTGIALAMGWLSVAVGCDMPPAPLDAAGIDAAQLDVGALDAPGIDAPALDGGPADGGLPDSGGPVDPLGDETIAPLESGHEFLEGPQWHDGALYFSDIPRNQIWRLAPPAAAEVYDDASAGSNGLAEDEDGNLIRCEHGGRRVAREAAEDSWATIVDRFEGDRFSSPNDLVVRSDGTIYFTDPPYGLTGMREIDFTGVFRVAASDPGVAIAEWRGPASARPNGIALTLDETTLYVTETDPGRVRRFEVASSGALTDRGVLTDDAPNADGMAVDVAGNLFVGTRDGVSVFAPDGTRWGLIETDAAATNCAFGGDDARTLYVTAGATLYAVTGLRFAGIP